MQSKADDIGERMRDMLGKAEAPMPAARRSTSEDRRREAPRDRT
jgi:hypothetical protein